MRNKAVIIILSIFVLLTSCETVSSVPDYSDPSLWAYYAEGDGLDADLFIIAPTVDMGGDGNSNMSLSDEGTKEAFIGALNMERGIFDEYTAMYSPFYRQMTFPVYDRRESEEGAPLDIAYSDVRNAFIYFLDNISIDRPIIIAGFSQGAQLSLMLLEEFFSDEALQERLVAAYIIGWHVNDEDLAKYPHLKMAEGEDDTGVIVSFNTEAPGITDSIIIPEGMKTHSINPLNWKTDNTFADRSLSEGACFTDYSGSITKEVENITGAYIDEERGTLIAIDIIPSDYSSSLFPDGVYHLYDYQFFFRDLQSNVETRLLSFLNASEAEMSA